MDAQLEGMGYILYNRKWSNQEMVATLSVLFCLLVRALTNAASIFYCCLCGQHVKGFQSVGLLIHSCMHTITAISLNELCTNLFHFYKYVHYILKQCR